MIQMLAASEMENIGSSRELDTFKERCQLVFRFSLLFLISAILCVMMNFAAVEAEPFPAPNLQHCRSPEGCCTPVLSNRSKAFKFPGKEDLPVRIRRAAHLVDDAYIAKYQRATELMRALPDSDPRSFVNQYKLHCVYCDNCLYFENKSSSYPLEIHRSWLFYPWHRLYLYFYERILATLIHDDTFALPFWNWDNQSPELPQGPVVPKVYSMKRSFWKHAINKTSSLYDPDRTSCAQTDGGFVEFQNMTACPPFDGDVDEAEVRAANAHSLFMNMLGVGVTPQLFQGGAYRFGDAGGGGEGSLEAVPHGSVHGWVNFHDMERFKDAASDPIFFGHHANLDRLWALWKTLPGGIRGDIPDLDYQNTEFTFYDEHGAMVTVSIRQALSMESLRYTYQEVPNPWLHRGAVRENGKPNWKICNPRNSQSDLQALINATKLFQGPLNFTRTSHTFRVQRDPRRAEFEDGEEILELRGDVHLAAFARGEELAVTAFAFHPEAGLDESQGCAEYLGLRWLFSHTGISRDTPRQDVWRTGIRHQLHLMGHAHLDSLVVTLVGSARSVPSIVFTSARIIYSKD